MLHVRPQYVIPPVVGYATKGVLHEVDKNGTLLEEWTWPAGGAFGYIEKRPSLYGPPIK